MIDPRLGRVLLLLVAVTNAAVAQGPTRSPSLVVLPAVNATGNRAVARWSLGWQVLLQERLREVPALRTPRFQEASDLVDEALAGKLPVDSVAVRNRIAERFDAELLLAVTMTAAPEEWGLTVELIEPRLGPKPVAEMPPVTGTDVTVLVDSVVTWAVKQALGVSTVELRPLTLPNQQLDGREVTWFVNAFLLWPYVSPADKEKGKLAESTDALKKLVGRPSFFPLTHQWYIVNLLAAGERAAAVDVATRFQTGRRNDPRAVLLLGTTLAAAGQDQLAIERLTEAANLTKGSFAAVSALAGVYQRIGRMGQALGQYSAAAAMWPKAAWLHQRYAELALTANRLDEAVKGFSAALGINPASPAALRGQAKALLRLGRAAEAVQVAGRLLAAGATDLEAKLLQAEAALLTGDAAGALAAVQELGEAAAESVQAQRLLGRAAMALSDWAVAETGLAAAVALDPKDVETYRDLQAVQVYAGKLDDAVKTLAEALKQAPDVDRSRLRLDLGWVQLYRQKPAEAVKLADQVIEVLTSDPEPHYLKVMVALAGDQLADAVTTCVKALELDPGVRGFGQEIIARLQYSLQQNPEQVSARLILALLYEQSGAVREAKQLYREFLARNGASELAGFARERIAAIEAAGG